MKGYIYTLEALLAVSLVLLSMTVIFKQTPDYGATANLVKFTGSNAIKYMVDAGYLDGDKNEIAAIFEGVLPSSIGFALDVCGNECVPSKDLPEKSIIIIDYYRLKDANPEKIRFWLWEK